VFPDGSVVNLADAAGNRVFPYGQVYAADQVLQGVITSGTGTAANYGCPAAGKTGTSENLANAWFVGYTPQLSTAVWVGYAQGNIPMASGFGGILAAPIWHDYMLPASNGYCGDFALPAVPWQGKPFFGKYATSGQPIQGPTGATGTPGNAGTTGTTGATSPTGPTTTTSTPPPATTTPPPATSPSGGGGVQSIGNGGNGNGKGH
jgi:penicillin-binding protein 1A